MVSPSQVLSMEFIFGITRFGKRSLPCWVGLLACAAWLPALEMRTPSAPSQPRIHGPEVYGVRPGKPVIYRIPATGVRPMKFEVKGLPAALRLEASTGIITGSAPPSPGRYTVTLRATNSMGSARRTLIFVVGDKLALTPPMGWNSWYTHYNRVTDRTMRAAADAMIASGMADYGYSYVNVDDCWMRLAGEGARDAQGRQLTNEHFPDMKALAGYIHAKGLKAGLYTSPGPATCAKYEGAYGHEEQDAQLFAEWGFDFLKYDWCSYSRIAKDRSLPELKKPYERMSSILKTLNRDIVHNFCQYGMGDVWKWGETAGGECWRTTGDLGLEKDTRLPGFYSIGFKNAAAWEYARPGAWNDPDYILIGWYGDARGMRVPQKARLTADEQYSYMSMWSLMAAPLIFSGDMEKLDAFTLNVLCNSEVIGVNQDVMGRQARIVRKTEDEFILAKPLADGSVAVGLFNIGENQRVLEVTAGDLGLKRMREVRDVWRQRQVGRGQASLSAQVPPHGVEMFRVR